MESSISNVQERSSSSTGYYTEEIEKFRKIIGTIPSYEESLEDILKLVKDVNFEQPPETYQKYIEFANSQLNGRLTLADAAKYYENQHDPSLLLDAYLISMDRDNDRYIFKDEFKWEMETVRQHDPSVRNISYEKFEKEADTNKDGRISVAESVNWFRKQLAK